MASDDSPEPRLDVDPLHRWFLRVRPAGALVEESTYILGELPEEATNEQLRSLSRRIFAELVLVSARERGAK